jgi:hypothetical protein
VSRGENGINKKKRGRKKMKKFYIVSGYHKEEGRISRVFNILKDALNYFKDNKQYFIYCELKKAHEKNGIYYAESIEIYESR